MRDPNGWIQTFTGKQFWPLDPRIEEIDFYDVAHALANICRYTGHVKSFYSVAQHSVLMSDIVPAADRRWALMHDAAEAYLTDIARPLKRAPEFAAYREAEERLERCIAERFDLPWPMPESVKAADLRMLATERRDLMATPPIPWRSTAGIEPLQYTIEPQTPQAAKRSFMATFLALWK